MPSSIREKSLFLLHSQEMVFIITLAFTAILDTLLSLPGIKTDGPQKRFAKFYHSQLNRIKAFNIPKLKDIIAPRPLDYFEVKPKRHFFKTRDMRLFVFLYIVLIFVLIPFMANYVIAVISNPHNLRGAILLQASSFFILIHTALWVFNATIAMLLYHAFAKYFDLYKPDYFAVFNQIGKCAGLGGVFGLLFGSLTPLNIFFNISTANAVQSLTPTLLLDFTSRGALLGTVAAIPFALTKALHKSSNIIYQNFLLPSIFLFFALFLTPNLHYLNFNLSNPTFSQLIIICSKKLVASGVRPLIDNQISEQVLSDIPSFANGNHWDSLIVSTPQSFNLNNLDLTYTLLTLIITLASMLYGICISCKNCTVQAK